MRRGEAGDATERGEALDIDLLATLILNISIEGMAISDPASGTLLAVNQAWSDITGWSNDEVAGKTTAELGIWVDTAKREDIMRLLRAGTLLESTPVRFRTKAGAIREGEGRGQVAVVDGREYLISNLRDVTDQLSVLDELTASRADLARAQRMTRTGSWVWDLPTDRVRWSDEMYRLYWFEPDEFHGTLHEGRTRIHPDDVAMVDDAVEQSIASAGSYGLEHRLLSPEGEVRWVYVEGEFELDHAGTPVRLVGASQDITDRKLAEETRSMLLARLVGAEEQERTRIANDIHDDPIQALTAAQMRLAILRGHTSDPAQLSELDRFEQALSASIERLRHLMFELSPPSLDREGLGQAINDLLSMMVDDGSLEVVVDAVSEVETPLEIRTVAYRIIHEALSNLRKHAGARRAWIHVETGDQGLHASVEDDGAGFERTAMDDAGPGHMGLRAMHERAQLAGGWLRIGPRDDVGTVVEFWLPLHPGMTHVMPAER